MAKEVTSHVKGSETVVGPEQFRIDDLYSARDVTATGYFKGGLGAGVFNNLCGNRIATPCKSK